VARLLPAGPAEGQASIVALGVDVTVHASAEAFAVSDASLLSDAEQSGQPPAHFVERGWSWPPRMAAELFISYGAFTTGESAEAYARLNGVVRTADVRTVTATGQRFVAARVHGAGFEADVCLPAGEQTMASAPRTSAGGG